MTIFHALILGIIEGLTEFLPISSTAHLILVSNLLKIPSTDFLKTFEISIQLGAILAVVILYWKKIWQSRDLVKKIISAFIPTAIIGFILYKFLKAYLMDNLFLVAATIFLGGITIIIFEKYQTNKQNGLNNEAVKITNNDQDGLKNLSYKQTLIIGLSQSLAIIPGVSRSAATIIGGLSLGVKRQDIVEFSFLLAIPTMLAATGLDILKSRDLILNMGSQNILAWIIGFIASFITALIGVKFFIKFIQKNNLAAFGWYRVILGLVVFAYLLF